jgi:xylulokinase
MTGALGSEPSDASSTLLFDPHLKTWSAPLLEHIGLSVERLPPVFASHQIAGGLTAEMAAACGLLAGTPVVFGGSDVSLQALAQGTIAPGTVSVTIGTGGQIFAPLTSALHDPLLRLHLFCHAVPDTWHHEAAVLSAGLALRWLRDGLWPDESYAGLADAAAGVQAGMDGLFFLPFLSGERTPYMDAGLPASFLGLGLRHGRAHLTRAVMEGVVFALRQGLDLMQSLGTPMERLVLTGGATRHPLWLQLQADIFQRPVLISETQEATARGAALLAGVGVGLYADCAAAVRAAVRAPLPGALPDPQRAQAYGQAYQQYVALASMLVGQYGGKSSI